MRVEALIENKKDKDLKTEKEEKIITFQEVVERTKNKMLEEYTSNDLFDRYIAYRNRRRIKYS